MSNQINFPDLIKSLPNFEGHFNAFELHAQNCLVLFAYYQTGQIIQEHSHGSENIGVVVKGELQLAQSGSSKRYSVGQWYHIAPGQAHSARFDKDTEIIEFWFENKVIL
jgi:quercetin dioxygenase-like cupin family protein